MADNKYYIFGAHSRAQTFAEYMRKLEPERKLAAFLFDNDEENPTEIDGLPVLDLRKKVERDGRADGNGSVLGRDTLSDSLSIPALDTSLPVYLACRSVHYASITEHLKRLGFSEIIPVTPEMDREQRNQYVAEVFRENGRSFRRLASERVLIYEDSQKKGSDRVAIYVANSAVDQPLQQEVPLRPEEQLIQVGRSLTDRDLPQCSVRDDFGENISARNRQFCELTAFYWIWKNAEEEIVGLEHYRRRFLLPEGWQGLFRDGEADVILPVPLYVAPSLEGNYLFRHDPRPWKAMRELLEQRGIPQEEMDQFFLNNGCYSPCNMLIARREVFEELCDFMFPIVLSVANSVGEIPDRYQNRYPGFISERLISFFFYLHEERYRVVYADKSFLS